MVYPNYISIKAKCKYNNSHKSVINYEKTVFVTIYLY